MMILACDIGNSFCHFGIFSGIGSDAELLETRVYSTGSWHDEGLLSWRGDFDFGDIDICVICCVVDSVIASICEHLGSLGIDYRIVGSGGDYGIDVVDSGLLLNLGADRAMNILGGKNFYDFPFVVVDFGTATTLDVCDRGGNFAGGIILAGSGMVSRALHAGTCRLPLVDSGVDSGGIVGGDIGGESGFVRPDVIGLTTDASILSGLSHGYGCMVEGLLGVIESDLGYGVSVIFCGGGGIYYSNFVSRDIFLKKGLTLWGCLYYLDGRVSF